MRSFLSLSTSLLADRHSGASAEIQKEEEKKFKEVGEAFTILSDPKKKARYDSGQDLEEDGMNMGGECLGGFFTGSLFLWEGDMLKIL